MCAFDMIKGLALKAHSRCLHTVHAASLNYRDLIIVQGMYPFAQRDGVVPASDGSGEVVKVGKSVVRFKQGDKVLTQFNQSHIAGPITLADAGTGVGGVVDGSLREFGAYDESGLVHMPKNLNYEEGSTLTCAGLTAWNALYGLESKSLKPGDWVLTQGTGGVSIFALQVSRFIMKQSRNKADQLDLTHE